jgi:hypothetical protein
MELNAEAGRKWAMLLLLVPALLTPLVFGLGEIVALRTGALWGTVICAVFGVAGALLVAARQALAPKVIAIGWVVLYVLLQLISRNDDEPGGSGVGGMLVFPALGLAAAWLSREALSEPWSSADLWSQGRVGLMSLCKPGKERQLWVALGALTTGTLALAVIATMSGAQNGVPTAAIWASRLMVVSGLLALISCLDLKASSS